MFAAKTQVGTGTLSDIALAAYNDTTSANETTIYAQNDQATGILFLGYGGGTEKFKVTGAGAATFASEVQAGANPYGENVTGVKLQPSGQITARSSSTNATFVSMDATGAVTAGATARINANGSAEFAGVVSANAGIDFSGAQTNLAGMTSETLDAYEEGTYTPSAQNFTVSGTSTLTGQYVKIGRQVTVGIKFANTGTIAHSVSALITLPFAMASGLEEANGLIGMLYNANGTAFNSNQSGTQCKLDGEGGARFFVGSFTTTSSGGQLLFGGTYIAAS